MKKLIHEDIRDGKNVQKAGRSALGEFAPEFAHFNDDVLFGENWNNQALMLRQEALSQ